MSNQLEVLLRRQTPSGHRGSLRYLFPQLAIKQVGDNLQKGNISMLVSPTDNRLKRFRGCMDGLREDVKKGNRDRLIGLVGCVDCPIAATYANGEFPTGFFVGSELSADDYFSTWIGAVGCPGIIALFNMVEEGQITNRYAVRRLFSEAPCMNKARRFAKIGVSE